MMSLLFNLINSGQWLESHNMLITIISVIVSIIGIVATLVAIFGIEKIFPQTCKWRQEYLAKIPNDFIEERRFNKIYIQPYFTFKLDKGEESPSPTKHPLNKYFINEVFVKGSTNKNKVYCLLGDTGSGKTAALVHLFADYINSHKKKDLPYEIRIFSLRNKDVFDRIDEINENREEYILLLDALDENPMATDPKQYDDFIEKLNYVCRNFGFVIYTCRPQFFQDENLEACRIKYRIGGTWTRLQLCIFDDEQVRSFLNQEFGSSETELRKKADKLLGNREFIDTRPLVLTYIRDIVNSNRDINNMLDLYDTIVKSWLIREVENLGPLEPQEIDKKKTQWWHSTSEVAFYIYQNKVGQELSLTDEELREAIGPDIGEMLQLNEINGISTNSIDLNSFRRRSMLTRIDDRYSFTHKSFYEYFMAYHFYFVPNAVNDLRGMDFALQLVDDMYDAYKNNHSVLFDDIGRIPKDAIAVTYHQLGYYLQKINYFKESERKFQEASIILQELADENPNVYRHRLAQTLVNLATIHTKNYKYELAQNEYQKVLKIFREIVADTRYSLANLYLNTNQQRLAKEEYREALKNYRKLACKDSNTHMPNVAMSLINLAILYNNSNHNKNTEKKLQDALEVLHQMTDNNPDVYRPLVAEVRAVLASFHSQTNQRELVNEVLQNTYMSLATNFQNNLTILQPGIDQNGLSEKLRMTLPSLATTLHNLAGLHKDMGLLEQAKDEYQEALDIFRKLVSEVSDAYLPDVAMTLDSLANLSTHYNTTNQYKVAKKNYREAFRIYQDLAEKDRDKYLPYVAQTIYNLATFHAKISKEKVFEKEREKMSKLAEEEYKMSLNIRRELAVNNKDTYLPVVADTLNGLAIIHFNTKDYESAKKEFQESLEIRREFSDRAPDTYLRDVAQTLYNMALLYFEINDYDIAETKAQESLKKYKLMAQLNPHLFSSYVEHGELLLKDIKNAKIMLQLWLHNLENGVRSFPMYRTEKS